jgi:hypothetical protein
MSAARDKRAADDPARVQIDSGSRILTRRVILLVALGIAIYAERQGATR